LVSLAEETKN